MMMDGEEYLEAGELSLFQKSKSKNKNNNKRRFSDEQIKSMESIFESQTKLEPRKKLQLARELGLQPRQIAIWFQNRRARWKSKQLERDYSFLKSSYDNLADRFESLKKEKQSLLIQLKKLNDLQRKKTRDDKSDNEDDDDKYQKIQNFSQAQGVDSRVVTNTDQETSQSFEYLEPEEHELITMTEATDEVLTSPENWCSFDSSGLFDQSSSSSEWWDFWA